MNVVDSCGWLEYFAGGPNASVFAPILEAHDGTLLVPTLCLHEVLRCLLNEFDQHQALLAVAVMREAMVVPVHTELALNAAILSRELKLPMADSIILATARSLNAVLWTQDAHFAHIEGVRYCAKSAR